MGTVIRRAALAVALLACGPGPTEANSPQPPPSTTSTTTVTPTKKVQAGPDCTARAMEKLTSTITDAGMRSDLDASVVQEEAQPADATPVLQKLAPKLTACNPDQLEGCAFITTNVEADGHVTATEVFVSDALPADVITCLETVLKDARFAAIPKAGKMTVPVTFTRTR